MYGVVSNAASDGATITTMNHSYFLDGNLVGTRVETQKSDQPTYTYNFLLYGNSSIPNGEHTFLLQNSGKGSVDSLTILDYAIYTT